MELIPCTLAARSFGTIPEYTELAVIVLFWDLF